MAKNRTKNGKISGLWTSRSSPNLGPSAKTLVYTWNKVAIWPISVVRRTYRVIYITSPSQNLKNLENLLRTTSGNQNLLLEATSTCPNLGPSAKNLVCTWEKANIWSIAVVRRTYRAIYITSPAQDLKNRKICPEGPPGSKTFYLSEGIFAGLFTRDIYIYIIYIYIYIL